jgi:transposase
LPPRRDKVQKIIGSAKAALDNEDVSDELKKSMGDVMDLVTALVNYVGLNSSNSSKPPSTDPHRPRSSRTAKGRKRKPGAQTGHKGSRLKPVENPTTIEEILVDLKTLPKGKWHRVGFEKRQVFDVEVSFTVTEFQAEILQNAKGIEFVADFPAGVTQPAQYGDGVKSTSVYMSQHQLIPQARVKDVLQTQFGLSISEGSVNNFNIAAAKKLEELGFEAWARTELIASPLLHGDETGSNLKGKLSWIHCLCNEKLTLFHFDEKRGKPAMDRMGVLPHFKGRLVHDHWKPYFRYICTHVLCNAHHLRELERAYEQDGQKWALKMKKFLEEMNIAVNKAGGELSDKKAEQCRKKYRKILCSAEKECPENLRQRAQSKSRNLLERLLGFEDETLRFMEESLVPFTNNQGERDLRMTKVQQKISGCFRSAMGARNFCLIRSYLSTCRKNGVHPMEALRILFSGKLPAFMS